MAGAGYKLFSTGDVLSASDVNTYLQQQTVMVFASAAARTTALASVLAEGMVTYLKDTDVVEIYTGAAWVSLDDPNAIQNSIVDAKGDIITATADNTPARLAVGVTNGMTLQVDSTTATGLKWATAVGGGKVLQVVQDVSTTEESTTSTSYVDTALSIAITPSAASSKVLVIVNAAVSFSRNNAIEGGMVINVLRTSTQLGEKKMALEVDTSATENRIVPKMDASIIYLDSPNTTSATTYKVQYKTEFSSSTAVFANNSGTSSITLIEIGA
jgi:hypothetical protein